MNHLNRLFIKLTSVMDHLDRQTAKLETIKAIKQAHVDSQGQGSAYTGTR
jgi:hypothetical protein